MMFESDVLSRNPSKSVPLMWEGQTALPASSRDYGPKVQRVGGFFIWAGLGQGWRRKKNDSGIEERGRLSKLQMRWITAGEKGWRSRK